MEEEDNGEGGKGKKDGGHSWSLPNVRQVNVKPVFFFFLLLNIRASYGSQARALSCEPSASSSSSSSWSSSFILHPPLSPAGPGAGTEVPLLCTRGPRLSLSPSLYCSLSPFLLLLLFPSLPAPTPSLFSFKGLQASQI